MDWDILKDPSESLQSGIADIQSAASEAWLWLSQTFFVPGDSIVSWLTAELPLAAVLLGLNAEDRAVAYALGLSSVVWLAAALLVRAAWKRIRSYLVSTAFWIRHTAEAVAFRLRLIRRSRLFAPAKRIEPLFAGEAAGDLEEFEVDDLQIAILAAQSRLAPGHVITALDAAKAFNIRPLRAQQALDTLKKLHLVGVSFATTDGFPGYFLTRPGEIFLSTCGRTAARARSRVAPFLLSSK